MPRPVPERLRNQAVYIDIGVHCGKDGRELRKQFKEQIKSMGATIVDDAFDADIIIADPVQTASLDEIAASFSGTVAMYHYIADCLKKDVPIANYVMKLRREDVPAVAPLEPEKDSEIEILAVKPNKREDDNESSQKAAQLLEVSSSTSTNRSGRTKDLRSSMGSTTVSGSQKESLSSPTGDRQARLTDHSFSKAPAVPSMPPVPSFRMPAQAPFSHQEARDWACAFLRWLTTHLATRTQSSLLSLASSHMSTIAPHQLFETSFRNYFYDCDPEVSAHLREVIRDTKIQAERMGVPVMSDDRMDSLVEDAAKAYEADYRSLPALSTPRSSRSSSSKGSKDDIAAPRPPARIFQEYQPGEKRQYSDEGHAFMRQLWRWLLLRDPLKNWEAMANDAVAVSNGKVSRNAFHTYRKGEGKSSFQKIQDYFEADPAAFRLSYERRMTTHSQPDDGGSSSTPAAKRRRTDSQTHDGSSERGKKARVAGDLKVLARAVSPVGSAWAARAKSHVRYTGSSRTSLSVDDEAFVPDDECSD